MLKLGLFCKHKTKKSLLHNALFYTDYSKQHEWQTNDTFQFPPATKGSKSKSVAVACLNSHLPAEKNV